MGRCLGVARHGAWHARYISVNAAHVLYLHFSSLLPVLPHFFVATQEFHSVLLLLLTFVWQRECGLLTWAHTCLLA